jgi:hypothetical protein
MDRFELVEEQADRDEVSCIVTGCLYLTNFRGKLKIRTRKHTHTHAQVPTSTTTIPKLSVYLCMRERREKERASVREERRSEHVCFCLEHVCFCLEHVCVCLCVCARASEKD